MALWPVNIYLCNVTSLTSIAFTTSLSRCKSHENSMSWKIGCILEANQTQVRYNSILSWAWILTFIPQIFMTGVEWVREGGMGEILFLSLRQCFSYKRWVSAHFNRYQLHRSNTVWTSYLLIHQSQHCPLYIFLQTIHPSTYRWVLSGMNEISVRNIKEPNCVYGVILI